MARRDYDYDWRGIAMLTQQLGQLFEPSKARLMSQQQEHEMNMLMAKKAWDLQSKKVTQLETELGGLETETAEYEEKLMGRNLKELIGVSLQDGANPTEAAEIRENTDIKKFGDFQDVINNYKEMITNEKATQREYVKLNAAALIGEKWRKGAMNKKDRTGVMKDYYEEANVDGLPDLSYEEGQNMIKSYIKDNFISEGKDAVEMTFGSGDDTESFMVSPMGVAWRAGYETDTGTGTGRGKAEKGLVTKDKGRPDYKLMKDPQVIELLTQNNARIEQINNKVSGQTLEEHLSYDQWGDFFAKESARKQGWTDLEIADYVASKNGLRDALKEIRKRPGLDIPAEKLGVKHALSPTINKTDNPSTLKLFDNAKISTDILYAKILMKEKDDKYIEMITAYGDIMKGDAASTEADRQAGLNIILNWVNE